MLCMAIFNVVLNDLLLGYGEVVSKEAIPLLAEESYPRSDAGQCFYTTQLGRFWPH